MKFQGAIADILPHDPPMVLLDRYINSNETSLSAEVDITETSLFFEAGQGIPAYVGIEYMAQAISAFSGLSDVINNREIKPGFLLGSRKVELYIPFFPLGKTVLITVDVSFNDGEMAVFEGQIFLDGKVVARARINAFQPEDPMHYIQIVQEQHR